MSMFEEVEAAQALPVLLTTQLMAAEVYARFIGMSGDDEKKMWMKMLNQEIDHINYLRNIMDSSMPEGLTLPFVNTARMNEVCERATLQGMNSFILRLEGALRVECAELDFGLEALAAKRFAARRLGIDYPGDIAKHLDDLVFHAKRYAASPNIGYQILRLEELYDSSVRPGSTTSILHE